MTDPTVAAFARLVTALGAYRRRAVFVGGWAHRLHALHALARPTGFAPLMTEDADVFLRRRADTGEPEHSLRDLLLAAGFEEQVRSATHPPVTRYALGGKAGDSYVEFLVTQRGSLTGRAGTDRPAEVIGGVTAQRLPYLDLLAVHPWSVRLTEPAGFPPDVADIEVSIPNPATYMAHKVLVLGRRAPARRAKDILYVHDTLQRFSAALPELRAAWRAARDELPRSACRKLERDCDRLGLEVTDAVRGAHQVALRSGRASPPDPDVIVRTLRLGLGRIFGPPG